MALALAAGADVVRSGRHTAPPCSDRELGSSIPVLAAGRLSTLSHRPDREAATALIARRGDSHGTALILVTDVTIGQTTLPVNAAFCS